MKRWLLAACTSLLLVQAAPHLAHAQVQALSADGRWRAVAEDGALGLVDAASGKRVKLLPALALDGSGPGAVAEIHAVPARRSFVVVFGSLAELWEISLDPSAEPIFDGLVHDYKMGEGIAIPGFLNPRRTKLDAPLRGLVFDRSGGFVLGRAPDRSEGRGEVRAVLQVWQLDVRRRIAERVIDGDPDLARARSITVDGREAVEVPLRGDADTVTLVWRRP